MSPTSELPDDPALPQLHLALDASVMAELFGAALRPHGTHVEQCSIERVKYRPQRNCTLAYRLSLRDGASGRAFEQRVAARLCNGDAQARQARAEPTARQASRAGPSLLLMPALGMLSWWWPNDARLVAPRLIADRRALRALVLPELVAALSEGRGRLAGYAIEVAQYVPEHRLTARVDLRWRADGQRVEQRLYAKASRAPDAAAAHAILRALQASEAWRAGCLRTPRALLWQPAFGLHWQSAMPGRALLDLPPAEAAACAARLGMQLAALHGVPVELPRTLTPDSLRQRLAEVSAVLDFALPGVRRELHAAAARLEQGLHRLAAAPPATLHGDLHPRNVLADGEQIGLIDLDTVRCGPALLELGGWIAEGVYRAVLEGAEPMRDAPAWQALLAGYSGTDGRRLVAPAPALAWATAWALLTQRAWRCVVNLKPGRFAIAPRLVSLAARLADAPSLEQAPC